MTPDELEAELARGRVRPAYLLAGHEALLRDDARRALEAAVLAPGTRDFNLDRLEGDTCTPAALEDALRALPVLAERRLVLLREPELRRRGGTRSISLEELLTRREIRQREALQRTEASARIA